MEKRLASMAAIAAPCAMRVSKPISLRHTIRVRHERRRDVDLRKIVHGGLTVTQWKGKTAPRAPGRRQMASPSPSMESDELPASPSGPLQSSGISKNSPRSCDHSISAFRPCLGPWRRAMEPRPWPVAVAGRRCRSPLPGAVCRCRCPPGAAPSVGFYAPLWHGGL